MSGARAVLLVTLLAWPLQPLDDAVRDWMRQHQSSGTRQVMDWVSSRARVALIGGAVLGLVSGPAARACLAETALALLPVNVAVEGLKWTVNRERPDGDRDRKNSSFPSSHAANAFAVAFTVGRRYRRAAWPLVAAAALVAFSRMYLDRHWASDIAGAALIAAAGTWLAGRARSWWESRRRGAATV